jgi:hypothetical protein
MQAAVDGRNLSLSLFHPLHPTSKPAINLTNAKMQLSILLNLSLGLTAFAAPTLVTKRQDLVDINGEPTTFHFDKDSHGRFYHPKDFPHYDSLPKLQCEAHINYVPRISRKKWEKECPPSTFLLFLSFHFLC